MKQSPEGALIVEDLGGGNCIAVKISLGFCSGYVSLGTCTSQYAKPAGAFCDVLVAFKHGLSES